MFDRVWLRHMECACYFVRSVVLILTIWTTGCNPSSKPSIENANQSRSTAKARSAEPTIAYEDSTTALSIQHQYHNGEESNQFAYIESIGGGVAVLDYDRDGLLDLFFPGGGRINSDNSLTTLPGSLWKNDATKRFSNVTEVAGASIVGHYSNGVSSGDLNNDGFPDLLVTGYGGLQYFVNQGDGTFLELSLGQD